MAFTMFDARSTGGVIATFIEISIFVFHEMQILFLKFPTNVNLLEPSCSLNISITKQLQLVGRM